MKFQHAHEVRREPYIVHTDEFALAELNDLYPRIYEQWLEGWSRSYYSIEDHMKAIFKYATPDKSLNDIDSDAYLQAIINVRERLTNLHSVKAYDVKSQLDSIHYEQTSAAGYDYQGAKGMIDGENHKRAIRRAKAVLWSAIADDGEGIHHVIDTMVPDVGYTRTQLTNLKEKTKVRGIWGRAFHYILLEGTVAQPLLESFKTLNTFYHIGQDPTISVPALLSDLKSDSEWLYAIDWSAFDASVSRFEIIAAFKIIKSFISFPNEETKQCFELCMQLFIHKKIAAPNGHTYWSHKGIPSGSYYTSIIGSVINRLRIEYLWLVLKQRGPKHCYVQGDDSIIGDDEHVDPQDLADIANTIGWTMNPEKTEVSRCPEYVTFLGRTTYGGLNQRDLKRCIRLLVFPEYPVDSGRISAFRATSIADDAGHTSVILNDIAKRLRRKYGIATPSEIPKYFKMYYP